MSTAYPRPAVLRTSWSRADLSRRWLGVGFIVGLAIRAALLPFLGTYDMKVDLGWGADTNAHGLAHSYHGDYFPLSYQTFQIPAALASHLDVSGTLMLKALMLFFDIGCFVVLLVLFTRWRVDRRLALLYWVQPYFLVLAWLGYVDFEMGFFALVAILVLELRPSPGGALLAGVPLAADLLLKPQALALVSVLVLVLVAAAVRRSTRRSIAVRAGALLVAPALAFAAYSAYFYKAGYERTYLFHTYRHSDMGGALTANMLNVWYPVAYAFRDTGQQIYQVTRPQVANPIAETLTAMLLILAGLAVTRWGRNLRPAVLIAVTFFLATAVLPMTMVRAHENHFFFAGLFGTLLLGVVHTRRYAVALSCALLAQFLYLFMRYRFGLNGVSTSPVVSWVHAGDHFSISTALAVFNVVAVGIAVFEVIRFLRRQRGSPIAVEHVASAVD
jgi:hypothetical protein